ncbi:unnamed protein product [Paramecium sonneborni]|uniref:Uncharacterized protein n=1 Tax=Paramecium sonneborni TaxID=65129 RepID=A0A8S1KUZ5_9CILI|nr:unnamed protein product [Paramecium sonneborni]
MNQIEIECQNTGNCNQEIIKRICLNKNCTQNRIMCDICLDEHQNHIKDCFFIKDIPKKINQIKQYQQEVQEDIQRSVDKFLKSVKEQIELKFAFQQCPIFKINQGANIYNWTLKDFQQFSEQASLLNFQSQNFDETLFAKIQEISSMKFDEKTFERLFAPNQQLVKNKKVVLQGFQTRNKNYGITNFQKEILRPHIYESIEIKEDVLICNYGMKKLAIIQPNLYLLAENVVKLCFTYEGCSFNNENQNKFGLFIGNLNQCSYQEDDHKKDLILINEQAKYVQKNLELLIPYEAKQLFSEDNQKLLMLVFNKEQNKQSLSIVNLHTSKKAEIPFKNQFPQAYFCFSLSCSAKIKML